MKEVTITYLRQQIATLKQTIKQQADAEAKKVEEEKE